MKHERLFEKAFIEAVFSFVIQDQSCNEKHALVLREKKKMKSSSIQAENREVILSFCSVLLFLFSLFCSLFSVLSSLFSLVVLPVHHHHHLSPPEELCLETLFANLLLSVLSFFSICFMMNTHGVYQFPSSFEFSK